ncbi:serine hydrolase domain-containing protein [Enhygromyxa salina]|uniref:serine hydrolase domain-containing protein n=1 Tax=Enhygromyxa salina TaxID=215803 RepID=UPI0015E7C4AE|nr:serine hydrolase domain-containing protein [Enhygromyxa salina]
MGTYEIGPALASALAKPQWVRQAAWVVGRESLDLLLREAVAAGVTPGCVALVWRDQSLCYAGAHGVTARVGAAEPRPVSLDTIYDLASLTKVLCTTTLVARAVGLGQLRLDDRLPRGLEIGEYRPTLQDLLEHASGLVAHREFFHAPWSLGIDQREALLAAVRVVPLAAAPRERAIYTDLGFLLLGAWLEQLGGARLDRLFAEQITRPLGLADLVFFGGATPLERDDVAATEVYDAQLHGGEAQNWYAIREAAGQPVARGLVHDDNCLVMGGVAGHAGLFGAAMGVLGLARAWLERRIPGLDTDAGAQVWEAFTTPSTVAGSTRRLGFDGVSPDGSGSTGTALSAGAIGHLGFTGTSVWIDPVTAGIYVLLSNRVHPTRDNPRIRELRRGFHELAARLAGP